MVCLVFWELTGHSVAVCESTVGVAGSALNEKNLIQIFISFLKVPLVFKIIVVCLVFWEFTGHSVAVSERLSMVGVAGSALNENKLIQIFISFWRASGLVFMIIVVCLVFWELTVQWPESDR